MRKIQLQDLESLANHPIQELHTSDISEYQLDFQNLVQVLKKFKSLKILIIDHFGDVDDIQPYSEVLSITLEGIVKSYNIEKIQIDSR